MMNFEERRDLVKACTAQVGPALYRHLYRIPAQAENLALDSEEKWRSLPFLTKDLLLDTPSGERTFCNSAAVDLIGVTSGTSGRPPVFTPMAHLEEYPYRRALYPSGAPLLIFPLGRTVSLEHWLSEEGHAPRVIVLDMKNFDASLYLAKAAGVRGMVMFSFLIPQVGEAMRSFGMAEQISYIEIGGESCSNALYAYMRKTFPNAAIAGILAATEIENTPHGIPCKAAGSAEEVNRFHIKESVHAELIDPETGEWIAPREGVEGELVMSVGGSGIYASPLIRYRTGDMIRVIEEACPEHGDWLFSALGRYETDFLKIAGGVLRADEVERVLRSLNLPDEFELHRYEKEGPQGPRPSVALHMHIPPGRDPDRLADEIAAHLRVAPTYTYGDGVRDGRYIPLMCVPLDLSEAGQKKHKRMIAH